MEAIVITKNSKDILAINMKYFRYKSNLSQEKLAEDIDMSRSFLSQLESPNVDVGVSLDTLFFIAQTYNFDIRKFFDGYENLMDKKND